MISLIIAMVGLIIGFVAALPFTSFLFGSSWYAFLGVANIFFIVLIPIIGIIRLASRLFFNRKKNSIVSTGMGWFWILNLVSFFSVGSILARDFQVGDEKVVSTQELDFTSDTIRLSLTKETRKNHWANFDGVKVLDDNLILNTVNIGFEKSNDDKFRLVQKHLAHGRSTNQVESNIDKINYQPIIAENEITFPSDFVVEKGNLWRIQRVKLILQIPEGKAVQFGSQKRNRFHRYINRNISDDAVKTPWVSWKGKHTWTMEDEILVKKTKAEKEAETSEDKSE